MRVLIAHNRYRLPGGEERHIDLLERGLSAAGVEVARFERDSSTVGRSVRERIRLAGGMTYRPASGRQIGKVLEAWRPDVVHFHNLLPLLTPSALRAARRSGAAVVLTAHNYRLFCPAGTLLWGREPHDACVEGSSLACALRNPRGSWGESFAYGLAIELQRRLGLVSRWVDAFIAPSAFLGRMLVRAGLPPERIHVIAHGVPMPPASQQRNPELALFAGRLAPEKGIKIVLAAARLAPDVPLAIAGNGPLADEVRAANGSVRYLGRLSPGEIQDFRERAAFSLVPSACYEVLPFAALEGLASGRPVIATRMGGLPEIVEDGVSGYVIDPGSPEQLAAAMRRLWNDPEERAKLGEGASARARSCFSLEGQTSRLIELYERLVR